MGKENKMMIDIKSVVKTLEQHSMVLLRGFIRMVYGALTAGLTVLAIYGFLMIQSESGWVAVCEFVGAIATTVVALACMYAQGITKKKGARK